MDRKKVLMACGNYWMSPFQVGSHHIARGFVENGWDVAFISDPISSLHVLAGSSIDLKTRYDIYCAGGVKDLNGHLWTYVPGALLTPHNKPLLKTDWIHHNWSKLTFPDLFHKIRDSGFGEVDLIYFDTANYLFLMDAIKYKKSVFRVADKFVGFSKCTESMKNMEHELARKVDFVIYTAKNLREYVLDMQPKQAIHVPNGVNFEHFSNASHTTRPPEYENISGPIAVYVGAMDVWFDYNLLNKAAKALPHVSFVLIGPDKLAKEKIETLSNIHILGRRVYTDIPAYLYHADIGIIPFDVREHGELVNSVNPLKLYEYMACGLPVVSVEWDELRNLNSPAYLTRTPEEFIAKVESSVIEDRRSKAETYIKYAGNHRWTQRIEDLIKLANLN